MQIWSVFTLAVGGLFVVQSAVQELEDSRNGMWRFLVGVGLILLVAFTNKRGSR